MRCDHPDCTGVHGIGDNRHSPEEWCPAFRLRRRASWRNSTKRYRTTAQGFLAVMRYQAQRKGTT